MSSDFTEEQQSRNYYRLWLQDEVRFSDLDALGHVSSVRMHEFLATARTMLFVKAIPDYPHAAIIPILKKQLAVHQHEINYPASLDIGLTIERMGNSSVTFCLGIFQGTQCAVLARNVFVFSDRQARRSHAPPQQVVENFMTLAGRIL
ncbi:MAG: acyl-CoA thioesterase [Alphaproteobacteria bacterium]